MGVIEEHWMTMAIVEACRDGQSGVLLNAAKEDTDAGIGSTDKVCQHDGCYVRRRLCLYSASIIYSLFLSYPWSDAVHDI